MNSNNISDEELDRLFKATAENFDPNFDPEAWKAMEKKLDQVDTRTKWFKVSSVLLALFLLVSIPFIYKRISNTETERNNQSQQVGLMPFKKEAFQKQNRQNSLKTENALGVPKVKSSIKASTLESKKSFDTKGKQSQTITSSTGKRTFLPLNRKLASDSESKGLALKLNQDTVVTGSTEYIRKVSSFSINTDSTFEGNYEDISTQAARGELNFSLSETLYPETLELVTQEELGFFPQDSSSKQTLKGHKASAFLNSIQVAIAFAPDVTTIRFKNPESLSANAGVLIGGPITSKLSFVSGVVWANKVYSAQPEDYHFSGGYTYTSEIEATCKVLDIPLNLRYQVFESGKNTVAVQAGVSSYIMLSEKYGSEYSGYGYYSYEVKNENKHWFTVQNVSLVYTRAVSPVFSVGVEPFVKIPYSGIGAGKVNLTSAGVFFSAGYKIKLKP